MSREVTHLTINHRKPWCYCKCQIISGIIRNNYAPFRKAGTCYNVDIFVRIFTWNQLNIIIIYDHSISNPTLSVKEQPAELEQCKSWTMYWIAYLDANEIHGLFQVGSSFSPTWPIHWTKLYPSTNDNVFTILPVFCDPRLRTLYSVTCRARPRKPVSVCTQRSPDTVLKLMCVCVCPLDSHCQTPQMLWMWSSVFNLMSVCVHILVFGLYSTIPRHWYFECSLCMCFLSFESDVNCQCLLSTISRNSDFQRYLCTWFLSPLICLRDTHCVCLLTAAEAIQPLVYHKFCNGHDPEETISEMCYRDGSF